VQSTDGRPQHAIVSSRIDQQIAALIKQSQLVEQRIHDLSKRLQKSRRQRLQQKNKVCDMYFAPLHGNCVRLQEAWSSSRGLLCRTATSKGNTNVL